MHSTAANTLLIVGAACALWAPQASWAASGPSFRAGRTSIEHAPLHLGAGLVGIRSNRTRWFVDGAKNAPLWALTFEGPSGLVSVTNETTAARPVLTRAGIVWAQVPVGAFGTCTVTVRWRGAQDALHGQIEVDNRTNYALTSVDFPVMRVRATPAATSSITLVMSRAFGRSRRDPFSDPTGYGIGAHQGLEAPGPMQFGALVDDDGRGLFWATQDPAAHPKRFVYAADSGRAPRAMTIRIAHVPSNVTTPGNDYRMPYPVVLQTFDGDWWDAAQIYRRWAMTQVWTQRGPLETRTDVPSWVQDTHLWFRFDTDWRQRQTAQDVVDIQRALGLRQSGVHWYSWFQQGPYGVPDYPVPPTMGADARLMQQAGARPVPYLNALAWAQESPGYSAQVVAESAKDATGQPYEWREAVTWPRGTRTSTAVRMCATSAIWSAQIPAQSSLLVQAGLANGVYLDEVGRQIHLPCHDPSHGHPTGGGAYAAAGVRNMLRRARAQMRFADPNAIIVGEDLAETFIDLVDVRLNHFNLWPEQVPLWGAVYGDHLLSFGRTVPVPIPGDLTFEASVAGDLFRGSAIGRLPVDARWMEPARAGRIRFLRSALEYREAFAGYIVRGHLQRGIDLLGPVDTATVTYSYDSNNHPLRTAVNTVQAAAWSDARSLGLLIGNIHDTRPQQARLRMDLGRFEIPASARYVVQRWSTTGPVSSFVTGSTVDLTVELAPHELAMFVVRPFGLPTPP